MSKTESLTCPSCKRQGLSTGDFYADRTKSNRRRSICKSCDCARGRAYYADNRERVLARANARNAARRKVKP